MWPVLSGVGSSEMAALSRSGCVPIDLYPLLRNYDVWQETVIGIHGMRMAQLSLLFEFYLCVSAVFHRSLFCKVQLFSYPIELFREPMATTVEVDNIDS